MTEVKNSPRAALAWALLLPIAAVGCIGRLTERPGLASIVVALVAFAPHPLAWLHYRANGKTMLEGVPAPVRPLLAQFESWQAWLNQHGVCMRHANHVGHFKHCTATLPTRAEGRRIGYGDRPVLVASTVGMLGWAIPHVAIIDNHGLNDWVVARTPAVKSPGSGALLQAQRDRLDTNRDDRLTLSEAVATLGAEASVRRLIADFDFDADGVVTRAELNKLAFRLEERIMGHDRLPPPGYIDGFRPNVLV